MKRDNIKGKNKERKSLCFYMSSIKTRPIQTKKKPTDYIAAKFDNNWS